MTHDTETSAAHDNAGEDRMVVVAAAIVQEGRLLVVSKQAAPHFFYLPGGGKPDAGEAQLETLVRELDEELAAELAALRWISGHERDVQIAPAVRDHVLPLLRQRGSMASS